MEQQKLTQGPSSDTVVQIWVSPGGSASLPCNISAPSERVSTVLWYRDGKGEPIYTYDARGSPYNATFWTDLGASGFGYRARFEPDADPVSALVVEEFREEEVGMYRCRVDFRTAQTRNTFINVSQIVPPAPPEVRDSGGFLLGDTVGPYDEGESMSITCLSANSGSPPPKLTWYAADGDVVDDTFTSINDGDGKSRVQNSLKVDVLTKKHFGRKFFCEASNGGVPATAAWANVTVEMRLLPRTVKIHYPSASGEPLSVSQARSYLECRSVGSWPPATLTWWKKGKFMGKAKEQFSRTTSGESLTVSRVYFRPRASDHLKPVTCRAENTNIRGSAIEDTIRMIVNYPPRVILTFGSNIDAGSIAEGSDVYLSCEIRAHPSAYKVVWVRNGARVLPEPSSGVRILSGGRNLVLQGVARNSSGNYTCSAFNLEGNATSNALPLRVKYKPECVAGKRYSAASASATTTVGVAPKQETEISCAMDAFPPATGYRWTFSRRREVKALKPEDGDQRRQSLRSSPPPPPEVALEEELSLRSTAPSSSRMSYVAETERDYGVVRCYARNELGEAERACVFELIPAGPPGAPSGCDVHNHTNTELGVTCATPGFDGGDAHGHTFHLEVRDRESGMVLQNQSSHTPEFTVRGLGSNYGRGLNLNIYSSNSRGRSAGQVTLETTPSKVAELQIETPQSSSSGEDGASSSAGHVVGGLVLGLLVTVVFLLAAAVAVTAASCSRRRRRSLTSAEASGAAAADEGSPSNLTGGFRCVGGGQSNDGSGGSTIKRTGQSSSSCASSDPLLRQRSRSSSSRHQRAAFLLQEQQHSESAPAAAAASSSPRIDNSRGGGCSTWEAPPPPPPQPPASSYGPSPSGEYILQQYKRAAVVVRGRSQY